MSKDPAFSRGPPGRTPFLFNRLVTSQMFAQRRTKHAEGWAPDHKCVQAGTHITQQPAPLGDTHVPTGRRPRVTGSLPRVPVFLGLQPLCKPGDLAGRLPLGSSIPSAASGRQPTPVTRQGRRSWLPNALVQCHSAVAASGHVLSVLSACPGPGGGPLPPCPCALTIRFRRPCAHFRLGCPLVALRVCTSIHADQGWGAPALFR